MSAYAHVSANSDRRIGQSRRGCWVVAEPTEWLVKTGLGVADMDVGRKFYKWPGQKIAAVNMKPRNINFNLHSISKDMVPFDIPVTFTITPHDPSNDKLGFLRYAQRMNGLTEAEYHTILTGIIHGQTRILAGTLEVMEVFNGRDQFKMHVQEKVEKELIPYGLSVTNANISELRDMPGDDNRYFESLKQKAISGATNNARVEVAENRKRGDVGTKQREGQAAQDMARIEAANQKAQNEQRAAIAQSNRDLEMIRIECDKEINIKREEASNAPKSRAAQLQTELNKLEGTKAVEYLRSTNYAEATVEAESAAKVAEGKAAAQRATADADKYTREQAAQAELFARNMMADADKYKRQQVADAEMYARQQGANAELFAAQKEAEAILATQQAQAQGIQATQEAQARGIQARLEAQAEGLSKFLASADPELIKFYLALEKGLFTDMAAKTAAALQGMSPKINIWTQGGAGGEVGAAGDPMAPLRSLFTSLPPMLDAVASQTGVRMPGWMPTQDPNWEKPVADAKNICNNGGPAPAAAAQLPAKAAVATKK